MTPNPHLRSVIVAREHRTDRWIVGLFVSYIRPLLTKLTFCALLHVKTGWTLYHPGVRTEDRG